MTEEHTHISDEMWKKYAQGTNSQTTLQKHTIIQTVLVI